MTSASANESTRSASERRSGRPASRLRNARSDDARQAQRADDDELGLLAAGGLRCPGPRSRTGCRGRSRRASCRTGGRRTPSHTPPRQRRARTAVPDARSGTRGRRAETPRPGTRSNVMPIVYGTARLAEESVARNQAVPASTIRIPNRLSGRRHQATTPARTKPRIPQTASPACTPGSGMWSLVSARRIVHAAAASPATTTAAEHRRAGRTGNACCRPHQPRCCPCPISHLFRDPAGRNPLEAHRKSGNGWKERR